MSILGVFWSDPSVRLASSRCKVACAASLLPRRTSDSNPNPRLHTSTRSLAAPKVRARKLSTKVLDVPQSLQTRTVAARTVRRRLGATTLQPWHTAAASSARQSTRHALLPLPTERLDISSEGGGSSTKLGGVQLIVGLNEVTAHQNNIANQDSTIESIQPDLTAIKAEQ